MELQQAADDFLAQLRDAEGDVDQVPGQELLDAFASATTEEIAALSDELLDAIWNEGHWKPLDGAIGAYCRWCRLEVQHITGFLTPNDEDNCRAIFKQDCPVALASVVEGERRLEAAEAAA